MTRSHEFSKHNQAQKTGLRKGLDPSAGTPSALPGSLFGRDCLSRIRVDWTKICNIRVSETDLPQGVASQLRTTIQNHPNVFKPGLGTVKGITAKLEMKPDARPKFCKARPVPYALQEAVEAEYNRLES